MKFSEKWLREWVNPDLDAAALMHQITMAGLEVDGSAPAAGEFTDVVVAEIVQAEPHPNADKLKLCQVSDGSDTWPVVCGAPNARVGLKGALARVGAVLPGDFRIRKAKLRGEASCGMLCSGKELGLSEDHAGILELPAEAVPGTSLREFLALDDTIIEVDLTPNRADCFSLRGIAREVGALNDLTVQEPACTPVKASIDDRFPVELMAPEACPRYLGRVIRDIDPTRPTPVWMQEKLRRSGIRSLDPVVDVTNYVMLELGQPMHGFDLDRLHTGISVRRASAGEELVLLDTQTVSLTEHDLVIADAEGPLALAGVMGGERSGISTGTRNVFLECALFTPRALAGRARAHGLHTEASHRFERGVDWELQCAATERATQLLLDIVGGHAGPLNETVAAAHLPAPARIQVTHDKIVRHLGADIPMATIDRIFASLGFASTREGEEWVCHVPTHRYDLSIAEDLIEEVARIWGYNRLPVSAPLARLDVQPYSERQLEEKRLRDHLIALGYQEAVTYSFLSPEWHQRVDPASPGIRLANPISDDLSVMRTTLAGGLLRALQHNLNRQQDQVRLFEVGQVFLESADAPAQPKRLGGLLVGSRPTARWTEPRDLDFFDIKGDVESLLALSAGRTARFEARQDDPLLHPGQAATVILEGAEVGRVGRLHPQIQASLELRHPVFFFELDLARVSAREVPAFTPLSRFPGSHRDLAVIVPQATPVQALIDTLYEAGGDWLQDVTVFDIYSGQGIAPGTKSVALQLYWQNSERTLKDDEIAGYFDAVTAQLERSHKAQLRS